MQVQQRPDPSQFSVQEILDVQNQILGYVHDELATACCRPSQPQIAERPRQSA